jgi:hypothetical protein
MQQHVQRLSRDRPIKDFISVLERDGCAVVSDFTTPEIVDRANTEIRPYLDDQDQGAKVGGMS